MSLHKRKDSQIWWCRFWVAGKEYRRSTGQVDRRRAEIEERRLRALIESQTPHSSPRPRTIGLADLAGLDVERGVAEGGDPTTIIKMLKLHWNNIIAHFGDVSPSTITYDSAMAYVSARRMRGAKGQTIRRELQALRRGLRIAVRQGWMAILPPDWPKIKSDPPSQEQRGKLHPPEMIVAWMEELTDNARDEAQFALLTGLRATEIKRVRAQWVEPAPPNSPCRSLLRIPAEGSKTRRERIVGLTDPALAIIRRRVQLAPKAELIFSQEEHKRTYQQAAKRIGYTKRITLRDLRHTYATLALQGTGDATAVQAALGHTDLRTTQKYLSSTVHRTAQVSAAVAKVVTGAVRPEQDQKEGTQVLEKNGGSWANRTPDQRIKRLLPELHRHLTSCFYCQQVLAKCIEDQRDSTSDRISDTGSGEPKAGGES